jgi:hypothetical protein
MTSLSLSLSLSLRRKSNSEQTEVAIHKACGLHHDATKEDSDEVEIIAHSSDWRGLLTYHT